MRLTADKKEEIMASRGVSTAREEFFADQISLDKKTVWWVYLPNCKPFTMGGLPMTHKEALETAQCIWATTPKDQIKVA